MSIKALGDFTLFCIGVVAGAFYIEFWRKLGANLDFWSDQEMGNRGSFLSKYSPYQQMRSEKSNYCSADAISGSKPHGCMEGMVSSYLTDIKYAMASESSSNSDSSPSGMVVASLLPEKTYFCPHVGSMPEFWCCRVLEPCVFARFVCGSCASPS